MSVMGWLLESVKIPRFVWAILALSLAFIGVALGYQIFRAKDVIFKLSDKYEMAVSRYAEANEQLEAVVALRESMEDHFDRLHEDLERLKRSTPHPETKHRINVAQMTLRDRVDRMPKLDPRTLKTLKERGFATSNK